MSDKPRLDRAHGQELFRQMLRIRSFEAKCAELYQEKKIRGSRHGHAAGPCRGGNGCFA